VGVWKTRARVGSSLLTLHVRFGYTGVQFFWWVEPGLPGSDCATRCPWHPSPFTGSKFRRKHQPKHKPPEGGTAYGQNHKDDEGSGSKKQESYWARMRGKAGMQVGLNPQLNGPYSSRQQPKPI